MTLKSNQLSIVMLGASGAVGTETLQALLQVKNIRQLTLFGRNPISNINVDFVQQHKISISDTSSYQKYLQGHTTAICTLGVGEPSKNIFNEGELYEILQWDEFYSTIS